MHFTVVDYATMAEMLGGEVNPVASIIICSNRADRADVHCLVTEWHQSVHPRVVTTLDYIQGLYSRLEAKRTLAATAAPSPDDFRYVVFQADDTPQNADSVSWETKLDWSNIGLVPDFQYFLQGGYIRFLPPGSPDLIPWADRLSSVVWRGSTTGGYGLTRESVERLPRYQLCIAAKALRQHADVGISGVVQAEGHEAALTARLESEGVLRPYLPLTGMATRKYVVDIDGNSNSWNFPAKLRLGACVLKVASEWRQWFNDRLIAWEHYVPVRADMADFVEKVEWCLAHDEEARRIAEAGRQFALDLDFEAELNHAATTLDSKSRPTGTGARKHL